MDIQWALSLSPVIAFVGNVLTQIISARLTSKVSTFVFLGLFVGLAIDISLICYSSNGLTSTFIAYAFASLLTYLSLSFCYWGFLNLNRTSLRIRILRELFSQAHQGVDKQALVKIYSPLELISVRLQRLESSGKIVNQNGRWKVQKEMSKDMFFLAAFLAFLRKIIIPASYPFKKLTEKC